MRVSVFWFRRDLRLDDNHGLFNALKSGNPVLPVFIFDTEILDKLPTGDTRVPFIHKQIVKLTAELRNIGSTLIVRRGKPLEVFNQLIKEFSISAVYANHDYEPYAIARDNGVKALFAESGISFNTSGDQLIFEPGEVLRPDGKHYEVFTPFGKKWLELYKLKGDIHYGSESLKANYIKAVESNYEVPSLEELGFKESGITYPEKMPALELITDYGKTRDFPALDSTTRVGIHLRFGTVSVRNYVQQAGLYSPVWLNELIWREFFMHILSFFPHVVNYSFRKQYDGIKWVNDEALFQQWCDGKTGYPLVDAGMRELRETGFMHNRVRMVTASFLVKHLLTDWRWGEQWFADHLLDFELSSNNGNWQWAAGSGCDAAPYFRIFNPSRQQERFDPQFMYIKKWIPEFGTASYQKPVIDHEFARKRCIEEYKKGLGTYVNL